MPEAATAAAATTTTAAATTAAATTTTAAANQPWYQGVAGVDPEMIGHWQNNGWDKKSAAEVAIEATKSWQAAQKYVGIPTAELVRVPKDAADEAGWARLWTRLGKPTDPKEYDFSGVKNADGTPRADGFTDFLRAQAFALNMPKDTAAAFAAKLAKWNDDQAGAAATERAAKLALEKTELAKNWGANFEANKFVAGRAAAALGVDPATVSQLEGVIGYAKIMEMFRTIGSKIGEDKFVTSTQGGGAAGVMTKEQAAARIAELKADAAWVKAYIGGDAAKTREMNALIAMTVAQ